MPDLTEHLTARADDSHATPVLAGITHRHAHPTLSGRLMPACQALVRFFALRRIKPHAPPLVRVPVNSFEFQPCGRTPQAGCHWCSSRYLRISPLHREFHQPLPASSPGVSRAFPRLSCGLLPPTFWAAYALFTPSNSAQRLGPTYYRGCWHVVSRPFLWRYRQTQ